MRRQLAGLVALSAIFYAIAAVAAPAGEYATKDTYGVTLPAAHNSFGTSADAFRADVAQSVDGLPLRSKILAATDSSIFLQKNFGASQWLVVGNVVGFSMDPSFIKISPDSQKIALGTGLYKPLYVFPTSALSVIAPPDVGAVHGNKTYDLSYYDAAWRDSRYLFVDSGVFDDGLGSGIFVVDTEAAEPSTAVRPIVAKIPGASSGVAFDQYGNLITGNGYTYDAQQSGTGELKIWSADDIAAALQPGAPPLDYVTSGHVLAEHVLSSAWLGVDSHNNLYVGGGDAFGGSHDYGYAGVIDSAVLARALAGGAPLDRDSPEEFAQIAPDPCKNDDATSVLYVPGVDMMLVSYDAQSQLPNCSEIDTTGVDGVPPHQQPYFKPDAPDTDGDGVPDGVDNAYQTPNPDQADSDGDGYGDVADCDADNDELVGRGELSALVDAFGKQLGDAGFDPRFDLNDDHLIDGADFALLQAKWGLVAVCH